MWQVVKENNNTNNVDSNKNNVQSLTKGDLPGVTDQSFNTLQSFPLFQITVIAHFYKDRFIRINMLFCIYKILRIELIFSKSHVRNRAPWDINPQSLQVIVI